MKHFLCLICLFASFALPCASARAEALLSVCINEICSSNDGHYSIEGSAPDYVELHNLTNQELSLDGFFISDDEDHLQKYPLSGYSIPEKGYIILAADKKELPFKLSASGGSELFLSDRDGNILQRVALCPLEKDQTYSLQENGQWLLTEPTPLSENAEGVPYVEKVYVAAPRFSHTAGFYDEPFDLTLEGYKTYSLYYTTDGSVPDENSTLYTGPIHIEDATSQPNTISMRTDITLGEEVTPPSTPVRKATIIRAVAIDPDGNRSNEVTNTYFVGFQDFASYQNIAVLSVVADPYELFDAQDGIYVLGRVYEEWLNDETRDREKSVSNWRIPANYQMHGKEWEIPVAVQWFDKENELRLSQIAGLRINGNTSRLKVKKPMKLYARKEYGSSTFSYEILEGYSDKKRLLLRAQLGEDSWIHALLRETGVPVSSSTPCLLFLNGEFWGLYEIREKQDEKDIAGYYGLNPDDLLVIKNYDLISGTAPEEIKDKSSRGVYKDLLSKVSGLDCSTPEGMEAIHTLIDLDNYITYWAGTIYLNNWDCINNFTIWRVAETGEGEYADGRWRWIFQDLDRGCSGYKGAPVTLSLLLDDTIFSALLKNEAFITRLLTRIMDYANIELTPEYVEEFITPGLSYYDPYIKETYNRYSWTSPSIDTLGTEQAASIVSFFKKRPGTIVGELTEVLGLTRSTSTLSLHNLPKGIVLEINGHEAHIYGNSWTGIYFAGSSVSFTAGDIPGYEFVGWYEGNAMMTAERTVEVFTDSDHALIPVYQQFKAADDGETGLLVCINEICSSNGGHYTVGEATPDYIELRTFINQPISLDGYFISNDEDRLQQFSLDGYTVSENGYLILAADKKELPFKLSASEESELFLSDREGHILQRVAVCPLEKDQTYSLQENGEWLLTEPTPLSENAEGVPYVKKVYVAAPRFSHTAGFYSEPFDLTLEGYKTYSVYYTTDGSIPDENSTPYTGPIHIEDATSQPNTNSMRTDIVTWSVVQPSDLVKKATIIRAVAIDPDGNRSSEVTNTYFVGFQNYAAYQDIAVLSIVADPYDLFDEDDGIYTLGKAYREWLSDENRDQELAVIKRPANFMMRGEEWEIPAVIQWFDAENALRLSQGTGMRIHGNYSRDHAKKSFNLYARKQYGASTFLYDILEGLSGKKRLVVRENLGRDSVLHALLKETGVPASPYTPCLVFLNGEFWGLYEIREKQDQRDIADVYGLDPDELLVIKNGVLDAGTQPEEVDIKGTKAVYKYLLSQISSHDASTPEGYAAIGALIDLDNYITSIAANTYINNTDYKANQTLWRTAQISEGEYQDGRWRWIYQDLDNSAKSSYSSDRSTLLPEDDIFPVLWENSEFQTKFLTRIMDLANVELTPEYVEEFVTPVYSYYDQYLMETDNRFPKKDTSPAEHPGQEQISILTTFFRGRRDVVIRNLTQSLGITRGTSTLTLNSLPKGIVLEINGHEAHIYGNSWTGIYFAGSSVSFTAGDIPGYEFVGWYEGNAMMTAERTVEVSTDSDRALIPVYQQFKAADDGETRLLVCINEICSSNGGHYTVGGNTPDYIELRTFINQPISLDGYFISNDEDRLQQFSLDGYTVSENGYLILAADKKELPFKLSASEESELFLSDREGHILQRVAVCPLEKDQTYSLQESGEWLLTEPTPLSENAEGVPYVKKVYVAAPRFSHTAGFYSEPFDLTLEGYKTYSVYYTTDGSVPDEHATPYTGPIHIEDATSQPNTNSMRTDISVNGVTPPSDLVKKATIIRAVAIDPDGNRSNEVTNTYFVGFQNYGVYQDIAVLSIVADPYDLFDEDEGIYVRGKVYKEWLSDENRDQELAAERVPTNYRMRGREWEIPVSIQWFDTENTLRLSQGAGVRIHGNYSRERAKKSFKLYARKEYGSGSFQYEILEGMPGKENLLIRTNLGNDSLMHGLLRETGIPVSACTPCFVFINGEFWGLYEIREKQDEKDIASYYGLSPDDLMVIKNTELEAGTTPEEITDERTSAVYRDLLSKISALDCSTAEGFEAANELIDVDNYVSFIAAISYLNNTDYSYWRNFTIWRTAEKGQGEFADARWRWIFQDMDLSCAMSSGGGVIAAFEEDPLFTSLWKSDEFKTAYLTRVMDYANVELTPEYVREYITPILTYYDPYLVESNVRFAASSNTSGRPSVKTISALMSFFNGRRNAVVKQLTETFGLTFGTSTLSVSNLPDGIGLEINGHQAHLYGKAWSGVYFTGSAVSFKAGNIPGYKFVGWYEGNEMITEDRTVVLSTDADRTLSPVYQELPVIAIMNEKESMFGAGSFGFYKPLKDSFDDCSLLPDTTVKVERKYVDSSIQFDLKASVKEPQGFTLTVPLHNYVSAGGVFTLSVPGNSAALNWKVLVESGENAYQELPAVCTKYYGGIILSFSIPEKQVEEQGVVLRLEAEAEGSPASFILHGFRVYGIPMDASLAEAYEYARIAKSIGAEAQYVPDFEMMSGWSVEEVEAEIASLRNRLQTAMAEKAVSTVGDLSPAQPAWDGLEAYPAIVVDYDLIQAFDNEAAITFQLSSLGDSVYLYKATENTLTLQRAEPNQDGSFTLEKLAGTYFLLDKPVEEIRYRIAFDEEQLSSAMLSTVFFDRMPRNYLWMDVEAYTQYQEEVTADLPESWFDRNVYIYRVQGEELIFTAETTATDGLLRIVPLSGRYLLLDEPFESFAELAELLQREIADRLREKALENQRNEKIRNTLIIGGCVAAIVIAAAIVFHFKRKKDEEPIDDSIVFRFKKKKDEKPIEDSIVFHFKKKKDE